MQHLPKYVLEQDLLVMRCAEHFNSCTYCITYNVVLQLAYKMYEVTWSWSNFCVIIH